MRWDRQSAERWIPAAWTAVASSLLFFSGVFAFIFAVPIQVHLVRFGRKAAVRAAALLAVLVLLGRVGQAFSLGALKPEMVRFLFLDSLLPFGVVVALLAYDWGRPYLSWSLRLPAAGVLALLIGAPVVVQIVSPERLNALMSGEIATTLSSFGFPNDSEWLADQLSMVVSRTIGFGMLLAVALNWWFGTNLGRVRSGRPVIMGLNRVFVDQRLIWAMIGGLGLVVASWLSHRDGLVPALGWNVGLMAGFLFGVQGLGIVQHVLLQRGMPLSRVRWTLSIAGLLAFIPGINMIVIGGLPLLGMSEIWVDFRRRG